MLGATCSHGALDGVGVKRHSVTHSPKRTFHIAYLRHTNLPLLNRFVSDTGAILSRKLTGVSKKKQKLLTKAIKRAQVLALMPKVWKDPRYRHASYADNQSKPGLEKAPRDQNDLFADPPDIRFPGQKEPSGLEVDLSSFGRIGLGAPPAPSGRRGVAGGGGDVTKALPAKA